MHEILNYISTHSIYGIPMDIIAHFIVGSFIVAFLRMCKISIVTTVIVVFAIAAGKEVYDSSVIGANMPEHIKDIAMTLLPTVVLK